MIPTTDTRLLSWTSANPSNAPTRNNSQATSLALKSQNEPWVCRSSPSSSCVFSWLLCSAFHRRLPPPPSPEGLQECETLTANKPGGGLLTVCRGSQASCAFRRRPLGRPEPAALRLQPWEALLQQSNRELSSCQQAAKLHLKHFAVAEGVCTKEHSGRRRSAWARRWIHCCTEWGAVDTLLRWIHCCTEWGRGGYIVAPSGAAVDTLFAPSGARWIHCCTAGSLETRSNRAAALQGGEGLQALLRVAGHCVSWRSGVKPGGSSGQEVTLQT